MFAELIERHPWTAVTLTRPVHLRLTATSRSQRRDSPSRSVSSDKWYTSLAALQRIATRFLDAFFPILRQGGHDGAHNFNEEFKRDAVAQITNRSHSVAGVSKRLGVSQHSLNA